MTKQITAEELNQRIESGETVSIIDVREAGEYQSGKIPGAKNISFTQLALRQNELDKETDYIVVCQSGNRSKAASGILKALGFTVTEMTGGMNNWRGELS